MNITMFLYVIISNNSGKKYLSSYYKICNTIEMKKLFNSDKKVELKNLTAFIKCIIEHFK